LDYKMDDKHPFYPVFLNLRGRLCLVVGGGTVAWRKIRGLLESGAQISVVAPEVCPEVLAAAADGRIEVCRRVFRADDLEGVFLVYAATDAAGINARVLELARERGILAAAVDGNWRLGDFLTPARFDHAGVRVAVSSHGRSCCQSRDIKNELQRFLIEND
jgi:siroheme synthase-like protein